MTAICLLLAASCAKDTEGSRQEESLVAGPLTFSVGLSGDESSFSASVDSVRATGFAAWLVKSIAKIIPSDITKASPVEDLSSYGAFSLTGYRYDSWSDDCEPDFMFDEKVVYGDGSWTTVGTFIAERSSENTRFYGFAPYDAQGVTLDESQSGPLSFSYSVPSDVAAQTDLLVGASPEYRSLSDGLSMSFSHCLSAVTFRSGDERVEGTIKSITLKGIFSQGTYTCSEGWSGLSSKADFAFTGEAAVSEEAASALTGGESTMMLLPQTLPDGAALEVVFESGGETFTLSAPVAGDSWSEGKRCIYSLNFDSLSGMKISLDVSSLTLEWGEYRDIAVSCDPAGQNWTKAITGSGLSAQKMNDETVRVSNDNISGTDCQGQLTVTAEDGGRSATASVTGKSLQESVTLSPATLSIDFGATRTLSASGIYPAGFSLGTLSGASVSKDGNTISVTNAMTSYRASDVTLTATTVLMGRTGSASIHLQAKPETITLDKTSLTVGNSGSGTVTASGDYDTFTASLSSTDYAGISTSGNVITITNRNLTYDSKDVTLTATTDGDTHASAQASITLPPMEDYVTGYTISPITLSETSIGAGGGSLTVSGGKVTQSWASGKTVDDYADASISVRRTALDSSYPASVSGRTVSLNSLGTTVVGEGTYTVTASFSQGGVSATSQTAQFTQGANSLENSDHNPSGYTASVSIGGGISAAGGSATVPFRASHTAYNLYSSGSTASHTVYDEASLSITSNGNSAFSLGSGASGSGSSNTCTLSHSDMAKNVRTDNVTLRVVNQSSTSAYKDASASVSNSRHTGTSQTKDHTRTGSITYGSKSYGSTSYGQKSYGDEYVKNTTEGSAVTDDDTYGEWETYDTGTDCYDYSVSFAVTSWSPSASADSKANAVAAYHYERPEYSQKRTVTHNYHKTNTDHYYRDYTRTASRPYTRSASQSCNYTEYRTDTFDSGASEYVEESKTHTESWTDSGTETLDDDTGSDWHRDADDTSSWTSDGGYGYRTTYGTGTKKTDTVTPSSSESWLTYSGGTMYVTANSATSSRSATLSATNGDASASCSVTQEKAADVYDIEVK